MNFITEEPVYIDTDIISANFDLLKRLYELSTCKKVFL